MSQEPTNARKAFGDLAPHLAEITAKVLFGDVWENKVLSPRDGSLVKITALISLYRVNGECRNNHPVGLPRRLAARHDCALARSKSV